MELLTLEEVGDLVINYPAVVKKIDSLGDPEKSYSLIVDLGKFFANRYAIKHRDALPVLLQAMDDILTRKGSNAIVKLREYNPVMSADRQYKLRACALDVLAYFTQLELDDFRNHFEFYRGGFESSVELGDHGLWTFVLDRANVVGLN